MKRLYLKSARDLWVMKIRTVAITLIVAVAVAVYCGLFRSQATLLHTRDSLQEELRLADLQVQFVAATPDEMPDYEGIPGVRAVERRLIFPGHIQLEDGSPLPILAVYLDPDKPPEINQFQLREGSYLDPEDKDVVLVEQGTAMAHGFAAGQEIELNPYSFPNIVTISGVVMSPEFLITTADPTILLPMKGSLGIFFVSMEIMSDIFIDPLYNQLLFLYEPGVDRSTMEDRILAALEGLDIQEVTPKEEQFGYKYLEEDMKSFGIFVPTVSSIFLLVAFVVILVTVNRLVVYQMREIGALMAIGYRPAPIIRSYLVLAVAMGVLGTLVGYAGSVWIHDGVTEIYAETIGMPEVVPTFDAMTLVEGGLLAIGVTCLAALLPVLRLLRMMPQEALRGERVVDRVHFFGFVRSLESLFEKITRLPIAQKLGFRNLLRRPKLTAATVIIISLSLSAAIAFHVSMTSSIVTIASFFEADTWEIAVDYRLPLEQEFREPILSVEGLGETEEYVRGFGRIHHEGSSDNYLLTGLEPATRFRGLNLSQGRKFTSRDAHEIVMNETWFKRIFPKTGDTVTVQTSEGRFELELVGTVNDLSLGEVFVPIETAKRMLDFEEKQKTTGFYASISGDPHRVREALLAQEDVGKVFLRANIFDLISDWMEQLRVIMNIGILLSAIVAALCMLCGITVTLLDREGEYASLEAIGYGNGAIARIVLTEVLMQGFFAMVVAAPLGALIAYYFNYRMGQAWFEIRTILEAEDFIRVLGYAFPAFFLAAVPGLWHLFTLNMAETVRKRILG